MKLKTVKRTERGWAGHYCLANACLFRRNTLLEYKSKKWVISTVGNCFVNNILTQIGADRYYETMAFAAKDDEYNDADVSQIIDFDSPCGLYAANSSDFVKKYPYADKTANEMHEKVVNELIMKILIEENDK